MDYILDNLPALTIIALVATATILIARLACGSLWRGVVAVCDLIVRLRQQWIDLDRQHADVAFVTMRPGEIRVARSELAEVVQAQFQLAFAHIATMQAPINVPHTLHLDYRGGTGSEPAQLLAPVAQIVPSFSQLFQQGIIGPDRLLCGYHDNAPYFGTLKDVFSTLIIAKSGAGKTTLERYLVAQACLMGAQVGIIDPHGHTNAGLARALQPLSTYQLFEPAIEDKAVEQAMHYFLHMLAERLNTPQPEGYEWPIRILAVDEINMLIDDYGKDFATDLARIAERGRKVSMFVFAAGQSIQMGRTGGDASLRKAFVGRYVLQHDKDAVQQLIQDRNLIDMVPRLQPGQTIFVPKGAEPVPLTIPNTTEEDLRYCFGSQVVEPVPAPVIEPVPYPVPNPTTWQVAPEPATPEAARVKQLLKQDKTYTEIIAEVWGITQKGRAWQEASNELRQIVCSLIPD